MSNATEPNPVLPTPSAILTPSVSGKRDDEPLEPQTLAAVLAEQLAATVSAYRQINESAAEEFHPELSATAFQIARWLNANGSARQSELADTLGLERSVVSSTVGKMRKLDYVVSDRDPENLGAVIVSITDLGRASVDRAAEVRTNGFAARIVDWSPDEVSQFIGFLARFSEDEDSDADADPDGDLDAEPATEEALGTGVGTSEIGLP